jgi:hypothetical protein
VVKTAAAKYEARKTFLYDAPKWGACIFAYSLTTPFVKILRAQRRD